MDYTTQYDSPWTVLLASDGTHLIGLWICGQKYDRATLSGEACRNDACLFLLRSETGWTGTLPENGRFRRNCR